MQYEKIKSYILNDLMKEFVFITSPYFQLKSPGSIFGKIWDVLSNFENQFWKQVFTFLSGRP